MTQEQFDALFLEETEASREVLIEKAKQYASKNDRLNNFKEAAGLRSINPAEALMGMLVKHFVSVSDMAKNPTSFSMEGWDEKLRDIRNYTYLLKAVLVDMGTI